MDCYFLGESNDFIIPNDFYGFDAISPLSRDWFHWGSSEFENDGFQLKQNSASTKENLTNLNCDTRMSSPVKKCKISQVPLVEKSGCSSASVSCTTNDNGMRTLDDLFQDLLDYEVRNSEQNMDDIFLNSFQKHDLALSENPNELFDTIDSMHMPWDLTTKLDDLLTNVPTIKEDVDPNFRAPQHIEQSSITVSSETTVESVPTCKEALVLKEFENVLLKLNTETRICIRDALYRLANISREKHDLDLCQSGMILNSSSYSENCGGNLSCRQEQSRSLESKTNLIDRAVATLMFDLPEIGGAPCHF